MALLSRSPLQRTLEFALNNPFKSVYQTNAFDLALLVPYFTLLIILSFYGLHRYKMVYQYYKNRKNASREPLKKFDDLPRVTVQLPIYNERYVVEQLLESICRLEYPREKLEIQVLDDSTDETAAIAEACAERWAALGEPVTYIHRANREGFKAGALQNGLAHSVGELVAIFDADFLPPPDFLLLTVHYFADPQVGMVQTRWTYHNRSHSFLTQVEAILLDGHFVLEHGARSRSQLFFNFNGTAGILRRQAIEDAGGWQHDTLTEDSDLSYRAQLKGWKFLYVPRIECPSELPVDMTAFQVQQARWAKGLIQTGKKILPRLLRAPLPWRIKVEAWVHLTANVCYPLMLVLSVLLLPAMIVRFYQGWFQMLYIDLPLFIASFCSVSSFYLVSQKELYPDRWHRTLLFIPFLMGTGIGLTLTNTRAVVEALAGVKSPFHRTAKYGNKQATKYRRRSHWLPWINLLIGSYFLLTVLYAISAENYITVPFLLLFVLGYYYAGVLMLVQDRRETWARLAEVLLPARLTVRHARQ
ncbi:MAG TPA: cellulose synthase family protein [Bryobacterales bacterium]|nr:cellulose synthase family protein [Bryobacterales bacterium]